MHETHQVKCVNELQVNSLSGRRHFGNVTGDNGDVKSRLTTADNKDERMMGEVIFSKNSQTRVRARLL